jgi:hypothetical protein
MTDKNANKMVHVTDDASLAMNLRPVGVIRNRTKEPSLVADNDGIAIRGGLDDAVKRVRKAERDVRDRHQRGLDRYPRWYRWIFSSDSVVLGAPGKEFFPQHGVEIPEWMHQIQRECEREE